MGDPYQKVCQILACAGLIVFAIDTVGQGERRNFYDSAISADWCEEKALRIRVQIIDKYFGNLAIIFGFKNENEASVRMTKTAEDFLDKYAGYAVAKRKD